MDKVCRICGEAKPLDEEHWHRRQPSKDGFRNECRACLRKKQDTYNNRPERKKQRRERDAARRAADPAWAAEQSAYAKKWHKKHPNWWSEYRQRPVVKARAKEANKRWREAHADELHEYNSDRWADPTYRLRMKEAARKRRADPEQAAKILEYQRRWVDENRERVRELNRETARRERRDPIKNAKRQRATSKWVKNNPLKVRAHNHKRRALRKAAEGFFTFDDLKRILKEQNNCCFYCGADISENPTVDHYIPLTKNGTNWPDNIRMACKPCNSAKGNKLPTEFLGNEDGNA